MLYVKVCALLLGYVIVRKGTLRKDACTVWEVLLCKPEGAHMCMRGLSWRHGIDANVLCVDKSMWISRVHPKGIVQQINSGPLVLPSTPFRLPHLGCLEGGGGEKKWGGGESATECAVPTKARKGFPLTKVDLSHRITVGKTLRILYTLKDH